MGDVVISSAKDLDLDGVAVETYQAYRVRCGRWGRELIQSLSNKKFYFVGLVSHIARSPAIHMLRYLERKRKRTITINDETTLSELVYGKVDEFFTQGALILRSKPWIAAMTVLDVGSGNPDEMEDLISIVVSMTIANLGDLHVRVRMRVTCFPPLLLWFVKSPCSVDCPKRRSLSKRYG